MRLRVVAALLVILSFTLPTFAAKRRSASHPSGDATAAEWLQLHGIPFATTEPGSGIEDLRILDALVGQARVVALGEATHASHEFFAMKHRIFEYLVREKGFTVFSMEASFAEADTVNEYVVDGIGDPAAALKALGWTWNSEELMALIRWMREYNLARGERPALSFRGFDAQGTKLAAEKLTAYVQRVDSANAATLMQLYDCYRPYEVDFSGYAALPAAAKDACRANVMQLHDAIASRRELYTSRSNAAELERYLRYARTIVQAEQMNSHRTEPDGRDEAMAENVAWFANVEHPGEKVVVWAHNGHVAADADYLMGAQLRRRYFPGRELVIFGFAFDRGQFHAYDTAVRQRQIYSATAPNDGFEAFFRAAGRPLMFVDLREPTSNAARELFEQQPKSIWEIGILFDPARPQDYRPSLVLAKNWDVIVWIESVTATQLRP